MEVIMKRLLLILAASFAFTPIMATDDISSRQKFRPTLKFGPTLKERACMAAVFVTLSTAAAYMAYKYDWFNDEKYRIYANARNVALAQSQELVNNGTLTIPANVMPEDFHNDVIKVAISATNALTEKLTQATKIALKNRPAEDNLDLFIKI